MITSEDIIGYELAPYHRLKEDLQRFLILSSVTQRHGVAPDGTFFPSRLRTSLSRRLCQATRLALPAQDYSQIIIDGKRHSGLVDNQASANIMTLDFVRKHRFKIVPKRLPFELANGSVQYSIGYTLVSCALTRDQPGTRLHEFHIFTTYIESLVLGRKLLYDLGILSSPKVSKPQSLNRNKEENSLNSDHPLGEIMILRPEVRIRIRHSGGIKKILAVPDKGSGVDAMSLAFAQSMGYNIDREETNQCILRLASGLMIRSIGTVCASFEMDMKSARLDLLQRTFAIIVNFPFDIAFGNAFIHERQVFEANLSCLEWVHVREKLPLLCIVEVPRRIPQRTVTVASDIDEYEAAASNVERERMEEEEEEEERERDR